MAGEGQFAATGVTTGSQLRGVRFREGLIETERLVMRSLTGSCGGSGRGIGSWISFIWIEVASGAAASRRRGARNARPPGGESFVWSERSRPVLRVGGSFGRCLEAA